MYSTSNVSTAAVMPAGLFRARAFSNSAGLAVIGGTLDLVLSCGTSDGVLAWKLAPLESASIDPKLVSIRRSDPPTPGPSIRTSAKTGSLSAAISVPAGFADESEAFKAIVPFAFDASGNVFNLDRSFGTSFEFGVTAAGSAASGALTFHDFQLSFDVPTDEAPHVTNTYSIAGPSVVTLGATDTFRQHLVHQNRIGQQGLPTRSTSTVSVMRPRPDKSWSATALGRSHRQAAARQPNHGPAR